MANTELRNFISRVANFLPELEQVRAALDAIDNLDQVKQEKAAALDEIKGKVAEAQVEHDALADSIRQAKASMEQARLDALEKAKKDADAIRAAAQAGQEAAEAARATALAERQAAQDELVTLKGDKLALQAEIDELVKKKAAIAQAINSVTSQITE